VRFNITLREGITICVYKSHDACVNYTLRVEITLVGVVLARINFVSVIITLICVNITLCL
jgi:hypothetical protein